MNIQQKTAVNMKFLFPSYQFQHRIVYLFPYRVAVGSPKANSTKILFDGNPVEETGALYNCPMDMNPNDCSDISVAVLNRGRIDIFQFYVYP